MNVRIQPTERSKTLKTDRDIAAIIVYLQEHPRWVTSQELQKELGVSAELAYFTMHVLYMMDQVELGGQIAGRGRPKQAAHWIGRRTLSRLIATTVVEGRNSTKLNSQTLKQRVDELEGTPAPETSEK